MPTEAARRTPQQLRDDALRIWQAGLDAVRSERLVADALAVDGPWLHVCDAEPIDLRKVRRIAVVGAGKAGAGMAAAVETALGARWAQATQLSGWVNVPADCVRQLQWIHLHAARPPGKNEPTNEGVRGAEEILRIVGELDQHDLCLCLISGGASALLPAPCEGITLDDKLAVTQHLSAAGANIQQLNTVRKQLSRIKGGGLLRACRAGQLYTLVISDVIGDPLDIIGSGPTVADSATPADALRVLQEFAASEAGISPRVFSALARDRRPRESGHSATRQQVYVIGNNALAVDAAGVMAEQLGYSHAMHCATQLEGAAEQIGQHLAVMAQRMRDQAGPDCLITGGEPVVKLVAPRERGLGGRNQQLVLAAAAEWVAHRSEGMVLLSGATDGEDGPTDAAGAWVDAPLLAEAQRRGLIPQEFLRRNDAYHFFDPLGGLIKTGPTHTNICDVRVVVVDRIETPR